MCLNFRAQTEQPKDAWQDNPAGQTLVLGSLTPPSPQHYPREIGLELSVSSNPAWTSNQKVRVRALVLGGSHLYKRPFRIRSNFSSKVASLSSYYLSGGVHQLGLCIYNTDGPLRAGDFTTVE